MKTIEYNEFYKQMCKLFGFCVFVTIKRGNTLTVNSIDSGELESLLDRLDGKIISVEKLEENSEISAAMIKDYIIEFGPVGQDDNFIKSLRCLFAETSVLYSAKIGDETTYILYYDN